MPGYAADGHQLPWLSDGVRDSSAQHPRSRSFCRAPAARPAMSTEGSYRQAQFRPDPEAAELLLVRHGESEPYLEGTAFPLTGGHGDPPLAPEGRKQADQVCSRLSAAGIDAIYVTT